MYIILSKLFFLRYMINILKQMKKFLVELIDQLGISSHYPSTGMILLGDK